MRSLLGPTLVCIVTVTIRAPSFGAAQASPPGPNPDSLIAVATRTIDIGRPWQATRILAPLVATPTGRTPPALLAAARAASLWNGWGSVVRYLSQAPWLERDEALGHALLGRALLERSQSEAAVDHTRRAASVGRDKGARLVIHARALDRAGQLDSAAANYRLAAELLPNVRDWLLLRAAGVTADSSARRALFAMISNPVASRRATWTEALARDRIGDWRGAARQYAAVGARLAAVRQRLKGDSAARRSARADLLTLLGPEHGLDEVGETIALFDREFPTRSPAEELRIARRAALANLLERAARGYGAAGRSRLTDRDRFSYATTLARLGRVSEALPLFSGVTNPDLEADAAYQRARLLVRSGQTAAGLAAVVGIPKRFPHDSLPASSAFFLQADLLVDRRLDDSARRLFLASARYPTTSYGQRAIFQAALIAFVASDFATARREFDRISELPNHSESLAAVYWSGRSSQAMGDTATARRRYLGIVARSRDGYYALRASRRLGTVLWSWPPARPEPISPSAALERARALETLGLRVEARLELEAHTASASEPTIRVAEELAAGGWYARAARLAQRIKGAPLDRRLASLLFPLPFRDVLLTETGTSRVSPGLAAGVIRQESGFDPDARSPADARGLMQVLPSVGAELVRSFGIEWDPVLLYQPDVNLDFGIRHLDLDLEKLGWPERALAAYNAGLDRVGRWQSIQGADRDPEIFVERIPFPETRDYVRQVLANQAIYQALYSELAP